MKTPTLPLMLEQVWIKIKRADSRSLTLKKTVSLNLEVGLLTLNFISSPVSVELPTNLSTTLTSHRMYVNSNMVIPPQDNP